MSIEVMIKRNIKQGPQARKVVPLILQLRALATYQPGYISGRTLFNVGNPEECLVISEWQSLDDWYRWMKSKDRMEIQSKIEALTKAGAHVVDSPEEIAPLIKKLINV